MKWIYAAELTDLAKTSRAVLHFDNLTMECTNYTLTPKVFAIMAFFVLILC